MSTWIKLHDNFATNLKVLAAGEDAAWLYVCGLLYCSANLTDGFIPTPALRQLTAKRDVKHLAKVLTREGLWTETAHGWEVHDYLKVQRSRAQVEDEREKTRNRVARSRSRNAVTNAVSTGEVTPPEAEAETETEKQQQASPAHSRRALLEAAAVIIGERAGARPTSQNPAKVAAAVARGVITDRHQDAYQLITSNPAITPTELAEALEPTTPATTQRPEPYNPASNMRDAADITADRPPIDPEINRNGAAKARAVFGPQTQADP